MKVGAEVKLFNLAMRQRREELGLSQIALHQQSGCTIKFITDVERLHSPGLDIQIIRNNLNKIARALDMDFAAMFPADYLDAIQRQLLPRQTHFVWCLDVSLEQLGAGAANLMLLPNPEDAAIERETRQLVRELWAGAGEVLDERQRNVIEMRFGLDDQGERTLEEVAQHFQVTRERVRQIEAKGLHALRKAALQTKLLTGSEYKQIEKESE